MKQVFILSPLVLLFLISPLLSMITIVKADEGIIDGYVVTKGGKIEKGKLSHKKGYVIVEKDNKEVMGKVLKKGAWLRPSYGSSCRPEYDYATGTYYILDVWKEVNSILAEVRYRKHKYTTYLCISYKAKCWRVVKN